MLPSTPLKNNSHQKAMRGIFYLIFRTSIPSREPPHEKDKHRQKRVEKQSIMITTHRHMQNVKFETSYNMTKKKLNGCKNRNTHRNRKGNSKRILKGF